MSLDCPEPQDGQLCCTYTEIHLKMNSRDYINAFNEASKFKEGGGRSIELKARKHDEQ